jgi:hypothetical protein
MVDLVEIDFARVQTVSDCMGRETRVVLLASESLLLSRRDDAAVLNEGGGTIVVEGGDAKQSH